jgi:glycerol-3-phosphate dehydrogenase
LGKIFKAEQSTLCGLAGFGDAVATCFGPLSRNRQVGYRLSKGETLDEILASLGGVSEGINTAIALEQFLSSKHRRNYYEYKFPIFSRIGKIVEGKLSPRQGLEELMKLPRVI